MLKLKKIAKSFEVAITLHRRDSVFNRPLIQAFAIAIGLHLFFLFAVQIRSFNIFSNPPLINPVVVDADIAFIDKNDVLADLEIQENLPWAIREPVGSSLQLPDLPLSPPHFAALELSHRIFEFNPLEFTEPHRHSPGMEVSVSGPIAERYIKESLPVFPMAKGPSTRYVYRVEIDNDTGDLIWFERLAGAADRTLASKAESILRNLKFSKDKQAFASSGSVEIMFWREEG